MLLGPTFSGLETRQACKAQTLAVRPPSPALSTPALRSWSWWLRLCQPWGTSGEGRGGGDSHRLSRAPSSSLVPGRKASILVESPGAGNQRHLREGRSVRIPRGLGPQDTKTGGLTQCEMSELGPGRAISPGLSRLWLIPVGPSPPEVSPVTASP